MKSKMDRKWSFTGHDKRCWLNERWNLNAGKQQEEETQVWKEDTTNWTKGHLTERIFIRSKERIGIQKVEPAWWTKGGNGLKEMWFRQMLKESIYKDEPISNVRKLVDGGDIWLKDWRKQIRKERNYPSRRCNNLQEAWVDRKKETCGLKGMRPYKRWERSDEMMRGI